MMKKLVLFLCFTIPFYGIAQTTEAQIIEAKVASFFKDFHNKDSVQLKNYFVKDAHLQSVVTTKEGNKKVTDELVAKFIYSIAHIPDSIAFLEKISKPTVSIQKGLAHAWVPYQFYVNNRLSHCGVNSFLFAKLNSGEWKITNIIDTRNRTNCE
jgi:hypothetical protein